MGTTVIVAYRPKRGCEAELASLVREHVPCLRMLGLVTERPAQVMRAKDGLILEIFEWRDGGIEAAHNSSRVAELWYGSPTPATTCR